jgi:hypothetical protein
MMSALVVLACDATNQGEPTATLAPPERIEDDLRGALYCDCYKQIRTKGRWTFSPQGYRRWIPARVERYEVPCPGNILFLHRRYIT